MFSTRVQKIFNICFISFLRFSIFFHCVEISSLHIFIRVLLKDILKVVSKMSEITECTTKRCQKDIPSKKAHIEYFIYSSLPGQRSSLSFLIHHGYVYESLFVDSRHMYHRYVIKATLWRMVLLAKMNQLTKM